MVKKLKEKMHTLLEARKENKGFTLVELIVVIVILAILVGVTIGGIYGYVNKSRVNTDINNASSIQSVCATLGTDKNVIKKVTSDKPITVTWKVACKATATDVTKNDFTVGSGADAKANYVANKVDELLPDGLPAPKVADHFVLTVSKDANDSISVTCKAYEDEAGKTALSAQE